MERATDKFFYFAFTFDPTPAKRAMVESGINMQEISTFSALQRVETGEEIPVTYYRGTITTANAQSLRDKFNGDNPPLSVMGNLSIIPVSDQPIYTDGELSVDHFDNTTPVGGPIFMAPTLLTDN